MLLLDRQAWLHSAKSFLAAMIALYIALAADLERPYWAMATAYIVLQPVLGGTNSRGIYRISGTLIAAVAVIAIVPNLLQAPVLLSLAMSLWLSACLFAALLHRGPSSYVFMLAGYTAAFVGFPVVTQPDAIFDTVLARSEEIVLGSLCAVVVGAVVFPVSIQPMIRQRVDALMRDARAWCTQTLARAGSPRALRRQLAGDLSQLDLVIPFAKRDDPRHGKLDEWLEELRARLLGLLPVLAAVEDRLGNLGEVAVPDAELQALLADLRAWIGEDVAPTREVLEGLRARIAALRPALDADPVGLLRSSLLLRLKELAELWYDSGHLRQSIEAGRPPPAPAFGIDLRRLVRASNRHIDWGMLSFSSLAAGATLFAYCLLWIALGWSDGASGAMMAAVAAAFFAAQDDPAPNIVVFLNSAVVAMLAAGVYLFGILPAIHDFMPLVVVIAPVLLLVGLMLSRPKLFMPGMILATNFASLLSIQNHYVPDFARYVNSAISTVLGLLFALLTTRLFRSVGAEWSARRLVRQGWALLAAAAEGRGRQDRDRFMVRMLDLLGLLAPRLASLPAGSDVSGVDMLDEVRIGLNILNLRRARNALPAANAQALNRLLADVAAHYRTRQRAGRPVPAPQALKVALDAALSGLPTLAPGDARDEALLGLIGLRFGLFPHQPPAGTSSA
ncbi:FUSC family protein [Dyella sp. KRB-257]|uniref:FUSC family protein n=1 Tax=Dyella sp. KRB-257 TaxID=3400915 RepID=UPI003C03B0A1